jgi:hypothetical protein
MITRIIGKENLSASTVSYISYKLNAQADSVINKVSTIKNKDFGGMHRGLPWSQQCVTPHITETLIKFTNK